MEHSIKELVSYAVKAPSGHNTQPWKFKVSETSIHILPDYTRRLEVVDPDDHALFISLGCALENLLIAARHAGYSPTVNYQLHNTSEEYIQVDLVPDTTAGQTELFDAIGKRQSTRATYNRAVIPAEHLKKLQEAAATQTSVSCRIIEDKQEIAAITELVKEANIRQFKNERFRKEMEAWIRFNDKTATTSNDGLRSAVMGSPAVPTWFGKLYFNYLVSPSKEAEKAAAGIASSSALVVFSTEDNTKEGWVKLGQSFERFALQATALGIKHAHLNMPCEEVHVRNKLKQLLGYTAAEPLLLIRLGYGDAMPISFRRPVEEVLTS
jgi:nitroreductase